MKKIFIILFGILLGTFQISANAKETTVENNIREDVYSVEPVGYSDMNFTYYYDMQEYGYQKLIGFYYDNECFKYLYDEAGVIIGIIDSLGVQIVKYEYDSNDILLNVYSKQNGEWLKNQDSNFIGNQNKMLWIGVFYDDNTQCYYVNERYYNSAEKRYMDGNVDDSILTNQNPFIYSEDGIMSMNAAGNDEIAKEWAEALLANSSYGTPIDYSSSWYSGLSDVELLARAIFCEGGTAYTDEESAVAWVILNRIHDSAFPSTARGVITAASQFAAVTGGSSATANSRVSSTVTNRWEYSTYLACLMLTTASETDWETLIGDILDGQLYFYSYSVAKKAYSSGSPVFSGSYGDLKYGSVDIDTVYVLGYGYVTSFDYLFQNYEPVSYSRNIYYNRE